MEVDSEYTLVKQMSSLFFFEPPDICLLMVMEFYSTESGNYASQRQMPLMFTFDVYT